MSLCRSGVALHWMVLGILREHWRELEDSSPIVSRQFCFYSDAHSRSDKARVTNRVPRDCMCKV